MAGNYRKFLQLLEHWPLDSSKSGRDLGQHIRLKVKEAFSAGELFQGDESCSRDYESLKRLSNNYYGEKYPRTKNSSATGMTEEQCSGVLSTEFIEQLKKENLSIFKKIYYKIFN